MSQDTLGPAEERAEERVESLLSQMTLEEKTSLTVGVALAEAGQFEVLVGGSSRDIRARGVHADPGCAGVSGRR